MGHDLLQGLSHQLGVIFVLQGKLGIADHRDQDIIEFVPGQGGHGSEHCQPLGTFELFLQRLNVSLVFGKPLPKVLLFFSRMLLHAITSFHCVAVLLSVGLLGLGLTRWFRYTVGWSIVRT